MEVALDTTPALPRRDPPPTPENVLDLRDPPGAIVTMDGAPQEERDLPDALQGMYYSG
ncbi:MAG: hypothetical protein KJO84_03550 [Acidimicrobiia bacterium]|nr:hypothetical protein [Acidimicrobiia bacterium]